MNFDTKVKNFLTEAPHIAFNTPEKMIDFDFSVEKYKGDYNNWINFIRNFVSQKLTGPQDKKLFLQEIRLNPYLPKFLVRVYPQVYGQMTNPRDAIERLIKDINVL